MLSSTCMQITLIHALVVIVGLSLTGAFNVYVPRVVNDLSSLKNQFHQEIPVNNHQQQQLQQSFRRDRVILSAWLKETFNNLGLNFLQEKLKFGTQLEENETNKGPAGIVIRTASKGYDPIQSKPSSPLYTTKKNIHGQLIIRPEGVEGDYNHYRTTALNSTPNRAVSILTTDILKQLKTAGYSKVDTGDLGENIYVDGVDFKFFELGKRYKFSTKEAKGGTSSNNGKDSEDGVLIEITERIEPCGNLCKLPYINDETLEPLERFENCKKFLLWLDQKDGLRGWYAKVLGDGGTVKIGDQVQPLAAA
mmetsp:Transcript_25320/g.31201  ORF Transcript_25320/g.31201 Transcript_25320/m.31201 type:complete len:307 (-) Transcript_25320:27-947(-)